MKMYTEPGRYIETRNHGDELSIGLQCNAIEGDCVKHRGEEWLWTCIWLDVPRARRLAEQLRLFIQEAERANTNI